MTPSPGRRTRIKICGITRPDDARAAASAGADAIGLIFWPGTPRVVSHAQARAIVEVLPPFVSVVGLFVDPEPEAVRAALAAVPFDLLQFHGSEPAEFCRGFGRRYLKAIAVRETARTCWKPLRLYDDARGHSVRRAPGGRSSGRHRPLVRLGEAHRGPPHAPCRAANLYPAGSMPRMLAK